jgi:uncharacterized Zn-finger protein
MNDIEKVCKICDIKFNAASLKRKHDDIVHHLKDNSVKLYKCTFEQCNKEFSSTSKLSRHSQTHFKQKSFKCTFENCDANFTRKDHLINHNKAHSCIKMYTCDYPSKLLLIII